MNRAQLYISIHPRGQFAHCRIGIVVPYPPISQQIQAPIVVGAQHRFQPLKLGFAQRVYPRVALGFQRGQPGVFPAMDRWY